MMTLSKLLKILTCMILGHRWVRRVSASTITRYDCERCHQWFVSYDDEQPPTR